MKAFRLFIIIQYNIAALGSLFSSPNLEYKGANGAKKELSIPLNFKCKLFTLL